MTPKQARFPVFLVVGLFFLVAGPMLVWQFWSNPEFLRGFAKNVFGFQEELRSNQDGDLVKIGDARSRDAKVRTIEIFKHNPITGDKSGGLMIVAFYDIRSAKSRQKVTDLLDKMPLYQGDIWLVHKFIPLDGVTMTGGIFSQIALQNKVFDKFYSAVFKADDKDWDNLDLVTVMESLGVPFTKQRHIMQNDMETTLKTLRKDSKQAEQLNLTIAESGAEFYLNNYAVGGENGLPIDEIAVYAEKLLRGEEIKINY